MKTDTYVIDCDRTDYYVLDILSDKNPTIPFKDTYGVHSRLEELGAYEIEESFLTYHDVIYGYTEKLVKRRTPKYDLKYIVDHGNFKTQNTFRAGTVTPEMIEL